LTFDSAGSAFASSSFSGVERAWLNQGDTAVADHIYAWLNKDGTLSIGVGNGTAVPKQVFGIKSLDSGSDGKFHDKFPLSMVGFSTTEIGKDIFTPVEGDEFINTLDKKQWVFDGTKWLLRPSAPTGTAPGTTFVPGTGTGGQPGAVGGVNGAGWLAGASEDLVTAWKTSSGPWNKVPGISIPFSKVQDLSVLRITGEISGWSANKSNPTLAHSMLQAMGMVGATSSKGNVIFAFGFDNKKPSILAADVKADVAGKFFFSTSDIHETITLGKTVGALHKGVHTLELYAAVAQGEFNVDKNDRFTIDILEVDPGGYAPRLSLGSKVVVLSLSAYNALSTKDPDTIYAIKD
jgi:hypothetical protein